MKKYGIILDFNDKMITVDEVKLPMQNINYLQVGAVLIKFKKQYFSKINIWSMVIVGMRVLNNSHQVNY